MEGERGKGKERKERERRKAVGDGYIHRVGGETSLAVVIRNTYKQPWEQNVSNSRSG
jgi:hypothetical protein